MTYIKAMAEKVELSNEDVITTSGESDTTCGTKTNKTYGWPCDSELSRGQCKFIGDIRSGTGHSLF